MNAAEVATPEALVIAVFAPPANVPLAPLCAGAMNVTLAFGTGFPRLSVTSATRGLLYDGCGAAASKFYGGEPTVRPW